jgi:hypothetical protein
MAFIAAGDLAVVLAAGMIISESGGFIAVDENAE